jgi:hypothetical protein
MAIKNSLAMSRVWRLLRAGWWRRFSFYGLLGVIGMTVITAAYPPPGPPPAAPEEPKPMEQSTAPATTEAPLAEPIRLVRLAQDSYAGVRDYTCRLAKKERLHGNQLLESSMQMAVRTSPFSVYFKWSSPPSLAGQEACYVAGRNGGKMRVRASGLRGVIGFVSIDINDPRAKANSRHPITEAGIGILIEQFASGWEREKNWGLTEVNIGEFEFDHHRCVRVETIHRTNPERRFLHFRDVVYFDKESHLPIRMEAYDWPRPRGPASGDLLEEYNYLDLHLNVGLDDSVFNH